MGVCTHSVKREVAGDKREPSRWVTVRVDGAWPSPLALIRGNVVYRIVTITLNANYDYYLHCTGKETEAQGSQLASPHSSEQQSRNLNNGFCVVRACTLLRLAALPLVLTNGRKAAGSKESGKCKQKVLAKFCIYS